jgi:hypothetical protein
VSSFLLSSAKVTFHFSHESLAHQPAAAAIQVGSSIPNSTSSISNQKYKCELSLRNLLSLVDAAFRNLLCPRPIRTFPGIKSSEQTSRKYLSDLAPGIFVPGYAQSVADRAHFIPAIAKALTSVIDRAVDNQVQRQRTELLQQSNLLDKEVQRETYPNENCVRIKETIKAHLWLTLTNALRTIESTRRLKPLGDQDDVTMRKSGNEHLEDFDRTDVFDDYLNTKFPISQDVEQMLLGEEQEMGGIDHEVLFDLYNTSSTVQAAGNSCTGDATLERPDYEQHVPMDTLGCYYQFGLDTENLQNLPNSALSAASAAYATGASTKNDQMFVSQGSSQEPMDTSRIAIRCSNALEPLHWEGQHSEV